MDMVINAGYYNKLTVVKIQQNWEYVKCFVEFLQQLGPKRGFS